MEHTWTQWKFSGLMNLKLKLFFAFKLQLDKKSCSLGINKNGGGRE